jgi:hypothetical protein
MFVFFFCSHPRKDIPIGTIRSTQTLVSAGLFTPSLKPAKHYRDLFVSRGKVKSA